MTVILCPNDKMHDAMYEAAVYTAPKACVTSNFEQVRAMVRLGEADRVIVVMGAFNCASVHNRFGSAGGHVNSKMAYDLLKTEKKDLKVIVIDGFDWKIPGQHVLSGGDFIETLKASLGE